MLGGKSVNKVKGVKKQVTKTPTQQVIDLPLENRCGRASKRNNVARGNPRSQLPRSPSATKCKQTKKSTTLVNSGKNLNITKENETKVSTKRKIVLKEKFIAEQKAIESQLQENEEQLVYDSLDNLGDGIQVQISQGEDQEFDEEIVPIESNDLSDNTMEMPGGFNLEHNSNEFNSSEINCRQEQALSLQSLTEDDITNNPALQTMMEKLVEQKVNKVLENRQPVQGTDNENQKVSKDGCPMGNSNTNRNKSLATGRNNQGNKIGQLRSPLSRKSPLDTTIYVPALTQHAVPCRLEQAWSMGTEDNPVQLNENLDRNSENQNIFTVKQISDFIQGIRLGQSHNNQVQDTIVPGSVDQREARPSQEMTIDERNAASLEEAKKIAGKNIIDAEQFRATVAPKGMDDLFQGDNCSFEHLVDQVKKRINDEQDDEFFHIMCHIDPVLKGKIEAGAFVELEKLLPKSRVQIMKDDRKFQLYVQEGETFFAPPDREAKIGSIRRWEQAFRVYAAIYCNVNPSHSAEIWQYVYTINKAAASFAWENVYYYDITFRHLLEKNPQCSWGKTYKQMWNIVMCDPISKQNSQRRSFGGESSFNSAWKGAASHTGRATAGNSQSSQLTKKPKYCWKYNKNRTHDASCDFIHRCSFCDSAGHPILECPKKKAATVVKKD